MLRRQVTPKIRQGELTVTGKLDTEIVRRVIRAHFAMLRTCYEDGLQGDPNLEGRVTTKFVIGRDGTVVTAQDGGSDLPNQNVVGCVRGAIKTLVFPKPEEGIVIVVFPVLFSPGE